MIRDVCTFSGIEIIKAFGRSILVFMFLTLIFLIFTYEMLN